MNPVHELLRSIVGCWPFARGTQRIPAELGRGFPRLNNTGALARAGAGVLFPFQAGDIGHPAYWHLYEPHIRRILKKTLRPGDVFVDVGACRGFHSALALSLVAPEGFVIACEPHPLHASSLRRLAALNPAHRLCVQEVAISDNEGTAELLAAEAEGWHSLLPEFNQVAPSPRTVIPVSTTTLDRITSDYGLSRVRGVVVKIDAEGAEAEILRAASNTLSLPNLKALILECTGGPSPFVERARLCARLLLDAGFGVRVIAMSGQRDWCDADALCQVNLLALPLSGCAR